MKKFYSILAFLICSILNTNGQVWNTLGSTALGNTSNGVRAIAVSPYDGTLYVGGTFTGGVSYLAKYNSALGTWEQVGSGVNGPVYALAFYKNNLYVGGSFSLAGGQAAKNIVSISSNGSYSLVSDGLNGQVNCLYQAADSSKLYVGGAFTASGGGGTPLARMASIVTNAWAALGTNLSSPVNTITEHTVGANKKVYVGTDNVSTPVYEYSGSTWTSLSGITGGKVNALASAFGYLYAGGEFSQPTFCISKWDGTSWGTATTVLNAVSYIHSFYKMNSSLIVGGTFSNVGVGSAATNIAKIDGANIPFKAVLSSGTIGGPAKAINLQAGKLIAAGNWSSAGNNVSITSTTIGVEEISDNIESATLFPNPVTDNSKLSIKLKKHVSSASLMIYNNQGQLVAEKFTEDIQGTEINFEIEKNNLNAGIYLYSIILDGQSSAAQTFLVQ